MSEGSRPLPPDGKPRRRKRYRGTHPRRFDERCKERNSQAYPGIIEQVRSRGGTPAGTHVSILVDEVVAALDPRAGEVVADCTLGYGGHSAEFLKRIGPTGMLVGFDVDAEALAGAGQRLAGSGQSVRLHRGNFAGLGKPLAAEGLDGCDIVFADLGVSSMQIDDPRRGFSYKHDGPLDMRMDGRVPQTAADLLLTLPETEVSCERPGGANLNPDFSAFIGL
ncbi:MAG TPA: 16S rRNA (cytosine(1402)-N(4))-methyltransferase [Phycisphaerae bacterium]|nr:16S rRNA (cytosine(1402)-N(4))-methyltransferase [Phycisphaerae bacterium]